MPTTFLEEMTHHADRVADATPARKSKTLLKRIIIVAEADHDLSWLGRLRASNFEPVLLTSNFDAVQMLIENADVRMVVFAQRSMMMDGIAACQLLRQTRSEDDVAVVLMLNENLDNAVVEAFAAGVSDVVCHPFHTAELIARLDATRQRLLLWGKVDGESVGFEAEASDSRVAGDSMTTRPRLSGPKRHRKPQAPARFEVESIDESPAACEVEQDRQPMPPTRVTTRLAGDWLLTHDLPHEIAAPALDLSQLKFVPSLPIQQIEAVRQRGELSEVLLDRVWVCPQCRALPSFRPACPCCGSAGVERDRALHHFACAFVGATSEFQLNAEGLSCPKCCAQRLMVGTDCEFLEGPWRCSDCDWSSAELEIVGHCLKCGFRFPAQQAALEDLVGLCSAQAPPN